MAILQLPAITGTVTEAGQQNDRTASYLFQLTQQLQYVLNNLDSENFSPQTRQIIAGASKLPGEVKQIEEKNKTDFDALKQEILSNADHIHKTYSTAVADVKTELGSIINRVSEITTAESKNAEMLEKLESTVTQTSTSITDQFHKSTELIKNLEKYNQETDYYIERGELEENIYGVEIRSRYADETGQVKEGPFKMRLTDNRLTFYQYGNAVAYISNNKLFITNAEIIENLSIGRTGQLEFSPTSNGIGLKWRDGNNG